MQLHVSDLGPKDAPAIILIHGWSQCGLSFLRQHPLAETFRLIIPDLRGHGQSDKPLKASSYDTSLPWAMDLKAIQDALNLQNPILLGWSMGGWIVNDYIRVFGDENVAGVILVGSSITTGKALPPAAFAARSNNPDVTAIGMMGDDLAENISASAKFVQVCFSTSLPEPDLTFMTAFNMLCPPKVRKTCRSRSENYLDTSAQITKPTLVIWGIHEQLAPRPMADQILATIPNSTSLEYQNSGHAPFWEESDRFNTDLAAFANATFAKAQGAAA